MINVTLKSLAIEIHTSVDYLIEQFLHAGIIKTEMDLVTHSEKEILLAYLNCNSNTIPNKCTLQHKTYVTLNVPSGNGKTKSVKVEVRKKHIYMQQFSNTYNKLNKQNIIAEQKIQPKVIKNKYSECINEPKSISKKMFTINKQIEPIKQEGDNLINQNNNIYNYLSQTDKINYHEPESIQLKHKIEENKYSKSKKEVNKIIERSHAITKKHDDHWSNITNDHITTYHQTGKIEDNSNRKTDNYRHERIRSGKNIKQKKVNRISNYDSELKINCEETKIIDRSGKNKRKSRILTQEFIKPIQVINRDVIIGETITIAELANKMAVKGSEVIKTMMKLGAMVTINQVIDQETAQLVAEEMNHKVILRRENKLEELILSNRQNSNSLIKEPRAPVVTIMGHVDHGKTSLLDYIRVTKVAIGESGGITQHIGAYYVKTNNGMITFIDTPGHAAFTAMRARGVQATDIVVLVVAADDSVMPQTIEAIQHAQAAKVPIIVAINKIDKETADPNRVKKELIQHGIIPDEWGGENQFVHVSAKCGIGIDKLLEAILLQAEILELKAIHDIMANGVVIESFLDKGRGPIATVLIREGTLKRGDIVLCGLEYGRVRAMRNETGKDIVTAGPSIPVEILGLSGVPIAGDQVTVVRDEKKAREVAFYRQGKFREVRLAHQHKSKLEDIFVNMDKSEILPLNIVLKSDVQGSAEAISNALNNLSTAEVKIKIIGVGVGSITETDVTLAAASNAILIGFNVRADSSARRVIETENIDLRYYSVIYDLIDEVKHTISGMLSPKYKEEIIGLAEVRNIFRVPNFGVIAGCMVIRGIIKRHNQIRILRENTIIYKGELESLRRFKEDVHEVRNGIECGIGIKNYHDIHKMDIIEAFELIEDKRTMI